MAQELEREEDSDMAKKKPKFEAPPTICPILSIAVADDPEFEDCQFEACWLYNRAIKKCALVHMVISLAQIAEHRGTSLLEQSLRHGMEKTKK